jgi:FKBP-type peptidyl-prolyl cis-trans isomerase FkpA
MHSRLSLLILVTLIGCDAPPPPHAGFPPILPSNAPPESAATTLPDGTHPGHTQDVPGAVDPDAPEEFTTTPSGLKYRIRRKSDGTRPTASSTVRVQYLGTLESGKVFDKSYGKPGGGAQFSLSGVIPGWTEGLQLVGEGGMIELEIPSALGYGGKGHPPNIPPGAKLNFIVELMSVK